MPNIKIQRQKRSSLVMKLTPGGIVVYIPRWLKEDSPQVRAFIEGGLKKLETESIPPLPPEQTSADELRAMVEEWAAIIGVQPKRISIRTMHRKWGSCSSRENITLNKTLCHVPRALAEYVVCHELVHLRIFNHSKEFKAMMSAYMPDWREREHELKALRFV
jgi:predicted metal-dependent hydrolase